MKKLMTMLAAAAMAFGLYADGAVIAGTDFEDNPTSLTPGVNTWTGSAFVADWWANVTADMVVPGTTGQQEKDNVPEVFSTSATDDLKVLQIKTTIGAGQEVAHYTSTDKLGIGIPADGLYFDGLVNLTMFDEEPALDSYTDAKIAVYAQEIEEDGVVEGTNFVVVAKPTTAVSDGRFVCSFGAKEFTDGWHRLTIKAIGDIGTGDTGFVVFLDGVAAECEDAKIAPAGLTLAAQDWNANGQLFVSLVGDDATIKSVAFDGQGSVDELVFTTTAPDFAKDLNIATVKFDGDKVENVKYSTDDGATWSDAVAENPFKISAARGEALPESILVKWTGIGNVMDEPDGVEVELTAGGESEIDSGDYKTAVAKFENKYADIADAVAEANLSETNGTLTLLGNVGPIVIENSNVGVVITLDLNGKTVTQPAPVVEGDTPAAITVNAGALKIVGEGTVQGNGDYGEESGATDCALTAWDCAVTIEGGTFNGVIACGLLTIAGGEFLVAANPDGIDATVVPDTKALVKNAAGTYWIVDNKPVAKIEGKAGEFTSLAAAVAAAEAGDFITVFADTTETNVYATVDLTITNSAGVTVSFANDSADYVNYAFQVLNNATVTLDGTGTWKKENKDDSMFLIPKATAGKLIVNNGNFVAGFEGITAEQKGPSNILNAKGGSIEVYGGTFISYRCDASNGHCICAEGTNTEGVASLATIYGGSFTSVNTKALPVYAKAAGTGGVDGMGKLTIPGMVNEALNTAKFNQDETAYCTPKDEYKTKKNGDWYEVVEIQYATLTVVSDNNVAEYTLTNKTTQTTLDADTYTADADNAEEIEAIDITYKPGYEADPSSTLKVTLDASKTITIKSKAINYSVTFGANGGSGEQAAIPYTWGAEKVAPECTFTAPEKGTFNCWSNATTFATYAVGATLPTECESYELIADWTISAGPDIPVDDPSKLDDNGKAMAQAVVDTFGSDLGTYITAMGYADGKIPAEKLNKTTADLIEAAQAYNLKIMADPVTVAVAATTDGAFTFALADADSDNPVVATTAALELMVYTSDLTAAFDRTTADVLTAQVITVEEKNLIKVGFTGNDAQGDPAAAGFMKVDLSVEDPD